jgi:hypothetical protein
MKIRTTLLLLMSAAAFLSTPALRAQADTTDTMQISYTAGGDNTVFDITDVSRITFDGDNMIVATTTSGDKSFAIADIDKIRFDLDVAHVDDISANLGDEISIDAAQGLLNISIANGGMLNVAVFNMQGQALKTINAEGFVSLDLNSYTPGIYIIKANNKIIKYVR